MRRDDFHFDLPADLIAERPLPERSASALLCLDGRTGTLADRRFDELPYLLGPNDLLVLNDTRVIPARLYGYKSTGGRVELLLERVLDAERVLAHLRVSRAPRSGSVIHLPGEAEAVVGERREGCFELTLRGTGDLEPYLEAHGHMPLPPYIERPDDAADRERYQTVFARNPGAVAAPTAGLHFDDALFKRLAAMGVATTSITLHVGAGTFQPVRSETLAEHRMHTERLEVPAAACDAIQACRSHGGRVVAVGTTVVRALESAAASGELAPFSGETDIFIHPGYRFRAVDAMITNFHLPESSLLMLVSAFAGYRAVMDAYTHAVAQRYRFFSYGDAMFLQAPHPEAVA